MTGRVDHSFTDRTSMFGRYNIDDVSIDKPFDSVGALDTEKIRPSNLAVQLMHIFSTRAVNEAKFGVNRSTFHHPVLGTVPVAVSSVPGFDDLNPDQLDLEIGTTFSVSDTLSIVRGRHTFKLGGEVRRIHLDNTSVGIGISTIAFNSPDDFVNNRIDSVSVDDVLGLGRMRRTFWMGYGQDELKVRPNLTMNLGVRYEYYTVMTEADGHTAVVDFAAASVRPVRRCTRRIATILRRASASRGCRGAPTDGRPSARVSACTTARTRTMTSAIRTRARRPDSRSRPRMYRISPIR